MFNAVIFSKDRPAQLDLLIRSIKKHIFWKNNSNKISYIYVIYKCSDENYMRGYEAVISEHSDRFKYLKECDFKSDLIYCVEQENKFTFFLVDDDVFINRVHINDYIVYLRNPKVICYSMRLSPNLTYCYARNVAMSSPTGTSWSWRSAPGDYGYPMSLDGHIFRTEDVFPLLKSLNYWSPNSLEGLMYNGVDRKVMVCGEKQNLVGVPWNIVQKDVNNRSAKMDALDFLKNYNNGKRISLEAIEAKYEKNKPVSCHVEAPLKWV